MFQSNLTQSNQKPHPDQELFHYTSQEGLLGILMNKKIWLTHVLYLNDSEEVFNCWKVFNDTYQSLELPNELESEDNNINLVIFKSNINDFFQNFDFNYNPREINYRLRGMEFSEYEYFVFSFSTEMDDLSQWRAYTKSGYNIGFKMPKDFREFFKSFKDSAIEEFSKQNIGNCRIYFQKCIYEESEKKQEVTNMLQYHFRNFLQRGNSVIPYIFSDIMTLNLFFKNRAFLSENEYRIVVVGLPESNTNCKEVNLKFRTTNKWISPYVELEVKPNWITRVLVGPSPFQDHLANSAKMIIKSQFGKIKKPEVSLSSIPFRG